MLKKITLPLLLCLSLSALAADYSYVDFETSTIVYELDDNPSGNGQTEYGLWIDGGSDAYQSTESHSGDAAFAIDANDSDTDGSKNFYGSLYTKSIDFSTTTSASISFYYIITNSASFWTSQGSFALEVSANGGETFDTLYEDNELIARKGALTLWYYDAKDACNSTYASDAALKLACTTEVTNKYEAAQNGDKTAVAPEEIAAYWTEVNVDIPSDYLTKTTVLRIKSYIDYGSSINDTNLEKNLKTRINIDDITISYLGNSPQLSADSLVPQSDPITSSRVEYDLATFDTDDEWGVWLDGGRNAYTTDFLAVDGEGIALRWQYIEGQENEPSPDSGEDTGTHKPSYSSIYTQNLDMSEVDHLELAFSFAAYNLSIAEGDYFTLSISTNSGVDYVDVQSWAVGEDFINLQRYDVNVNIPGYLTSPARLTTTTMVKIQAWTAGTASQLYIDNVHLYTIGTRDSLAGTTVDYNDWSIFNHTLLQANADEPTYALINTTLVRDEYHADQSWEGNNLETDSDEVIEKPGIFGAVEHTDCDHEEFGEHITQQYDPELEHDVFVFHIHQNLLVDDAYATPDTDRCRTDGLYDDRQRVEIKTYSESYDHQKGTQNETFYFAWRFKIPNGFQASDKFTHLHQLKPRGWRLCGHAFNHAYSSGG